MTTYANTTFGQLVDQLATRLGDPAKIHWINDELSMYVVEAIRVFNSITGYHRAAGIFDTTANTAFYDLPTLLPALRGYTLTDQDAVALMQYQLLEPKSVLLWTGTEMFTLDEVVKALQHARDEFISATGCVTTQRSVFVNADPVFDVPETVIDIRRAVWVTLDGVYKQLYTSDEFIYNGVLTHWPQRPAIPSSYSIAATPNLTVQLYPPPLDDGTVEYQTVEVGAVLNTTANANAGTILGIPDDCVWGVRYGAMAKLLRKDGIARDEARAAMCDQLYSLCVDITRSLPVLLTAAVNNTPINITTLTSVDGNQPGWQGRNTGMPSKILTAGIDTLGFSAVPDSDYVITTQLVQNAIVPVLTTDFVQVSRDDIEAILTWAEMSAAFKSQGASLMTARGASRLMAERAMAYNERRTLQSTQLSELLSLSHSDDYESPMFRTNRGGDSGSGSGEGDGNPTSAYSRGGPSQHQSRARSNQIRKMRRR